MPEVEMYDEKGHLTLDGMRAEHAAGRSVLWPNAAGKTMLIRPGEQLPSEAEMAKGKPAQEEAVRQSIQAQIAELQNQMNMLGKETRASYALSNEQVTGNLPGKTAIHPDMVGAYPPQRGDGAQPLEPSEIAPEHRAAVVGEPTGQTAEPSAESAEPEAAGSEEQAAESDDSGHTATVTRARARRDQP